MRIVILADEIVVVILVREFLAGPLTVNVVNLLIEGPHIGGTVIRRRKGSAHPRLGAIDQDPGHDAFIAEIEPAALPVPSLDPIPPQDGGTLAGTEIRPANQ